MQIKLLVHLGEFVKTVALAQDQEVSLAHYQASLGCSVELAILAGDSQPFYLAETQVRDAESLGLLGKIAFFKTAILHIYVICNAIQICNQHEESSPRS